MHYCSSTSMFIVLLTVHQQIYAQYDLAVDESLSTHPNEDFIKTTILPGGPQSSARDDLQMTVYNSRELPELSSGVIGTVIYNESIFLSGLYRQALHDGHSFITKVRIPNYAMFRINRTDDIQTVPMKRTFYFNMTKALWEETIETPTYFIRSIMGVHAHYSHTFFHAIRVIKKQPSSALSVRTFTLSSYHAKLCTDSKFTEDLQTSNLPEQLAESVGADGYQRTFSVVGAADGSDSEIVVISNAPQASVPAEPITNMQFTFRRDQTVAENLYLQTIAPARLKEAALEEYKTAQRSLIDVTNFLNLHTQAWEKRYKGGNIELQGSGENYAKLRRLVRSSLYQIYGQFPFPDRFGATASSGSQLYDDLQFTGVGACGLGRGGNSSKTARIDFAGHVTPDQELFLFPPLAIFHPDLARQILFYRARQLQGNSPPVPFEAARSGSAVEPVWCSHCNQQAQYATGLLALAVRYYHVITRDQTWVDMAQRGGLDTLDKIARYLEQKIQKNTTRSGDYYSITGVCGPDEFHQSQTSNLLTNALASSAIHYWSYLRCVSNKPRDPTQEGLLDRVRKLVFPFNWAKGYNEQFEGYDGVQQKLISQSDVMLTYFPVAFNMSGNWLEQVNATRLHNDIQKYKDFQSTTNRATGAPATSIAIKAITHLLGGTTAELANGQLAFDEMWKTYASSPFYVWRNMTDRKDESAAGHIGTAAAFLQTLIFGFGGLRLQPNRLDILRPSLPHAEITAINFKGLHFNGGEFDYSITSGNKIRFAPVGGSAFKGTLSLYDRTNRRYDSFAGSAELTIPQEPSLTPSNTAAVYSLIDVDAVKGSCWTTLEDAPLFRSHNPYLSSGEISTGSFIITLLLLSVVAIIGLSSA